MPGFMSGNAALGAGSVSTAALADNAVTLAKMAGGTDGNLIGIDASGDPAYIATGSDGQVLTSGGAGVAALMESAAAAGGGFEFVETLTASSDATMTFAHTVAAGYDYEIICRQVNNTADIAAGNITIQVGSGGGPTFLTSNYTCQSASFAGTAKAAQQDIATDGFNIDQTGTGGNAGVAETWDLKMLILNPGANEQTTAFCSLANDDASGNLEFNLNSTRHTSATVVTGLRVNTDASDFETGTFLLFRRKTSA